MVEQTKSRVSHLVVDSAAFLKRAQLETFGCHIYTTTSVINELRDKRVRESLKCLSYALRFETPSKDSIKLVTTMAKKTGDFSVLSSTDIELIAVTYELHRSHIGEPTPKPVVPIPLTLGEQAHMAVTRQKPTIPASNVSSQLPANDESKNQQQQSVSDARELEQLVGNGDFDEKVDGGELAVESDSGSDLPDDDEWISEANFDQKAMENFGLGPGQKNEPHSEEILPIPAVACLTTDFAMQNVLLHMGLHLIGLDGMVITRPRTHLLWCGSCYRPTKRTDTYFCPYCAQPNLRRIPVTLMEDGQLRFHFSRRFVNRKIGIKQPIRTPRGGKHADEPIYCPDQRLPDRRPAKPKNPNLQLFATNGLLDDLTVDFEGLDAGAEEVAFPLHDVASRAARIGIRSDQQIPPRGWRQPLAEHGLKPTRGTAYLYHVRTGNRKKKH